MFWISISLFDIEFIDMIMLPIASNIIGQVY